MMAVPPSLDVTSAMLKPPLQRNAHHIAHAVPPLHRHARIIAHSVPPQHRNAHIIAHGVRETLVGGNTLQICVNCINVTHG